MKYIIGGMLVGLLAAVGLGTLLKLQGFPLNICLSIGLFAGTVFGSSLTEGNDKK